MRKYYWYFTAYLKKHGWLFILSLLIAIAIFSLLVPVITSRVSFKKRIYQGIIGEYNLDKLPPEISNLLSVGLTKVEADGSISPLVAERFVIEDEGKTYRFLIKKNLKWQDGKNFEPEDVSYQLQDTQTLYTKNEVLFKLPAAFAPFPSVVNQPLFRYVDKIPIGLGEYRVTSYQIKNNHLTQIVLTGNKEIKIFRFFFSENDAILAFKHGHIDLLEAASSAYDFDRWSNVNLTANNNFNEYLAVFFDNNKVFFPKNVRQALSYAIPKADSNRAISPIHPQSWAYLAAGKHYDFDLERAVERLTDEIPGQEISFTLTTTNLFAAKAEAIKKSWEELGEKAFVKCSSDKKADHKLCPNLKIKVDLRVSNFPDLSNFDALLIGQSINLDPDQYALWHSGQAGNFINYKNTRIDSLLEKGRQSIDLNERKVIYQEFQQFFLEDCPIVLLEYLTDYRVERK